MAKGPFAVIQLKDGAENSGYNSSNRRMMEQDEVRVTICNNDHT